MKIFFAGTDLDEVRLGCTPHIYYIRKGKKRKIPNKYCVLVHTDTIVRGYFHCNHGKDILDTQTVYNAPTF